MATNAILKVEKALNEIRQRLSALEVRVADFEQTGCRTIPLTHSTEPPEMNINLDIPKKPRGRPPKEVKEK